MFSIGGNYPVYTLYKIIILLKRLSSSYYKIRNFGVKICISDFCTLYNSYIFIHIFLHTFVYFIVVNFCLRFPNSHTVKSQL